MQSCDFCEHDETSNKIKITPTEAEQVGTHDLILKIEDVKYVTAQKSTLATVNITVHSADSEYFIKIDSEPSKESEDKSEEEEELVPVPEPTPEPKPEIGDEDFSWEDFDFDECFYDGDWEDAYYQSEFGEKWNLEDL